MEFSLKEAIHQAVLNQDRKEYKGIHASSLGSCYRSHFYKIKGIAETTPPNVGALMNFQMGHTWESTLLPLIDGIDGVKVHHHKGESWDVPKLNLYGTPDFTVEVNDQKIIVDSKTVNSKWFAYKEAEYNKYSDTLTKEQFLLKENPEYEIQQGTYLLMAKLNNLDYDHARLLFVNKDNSFIGWEVRIYLTKELEKRIYDRINYLNECLKNDTLPICECESWKVGYCGFGNPETRTVNKTKKEINTECCSEQIWHAHTKEVV